MSISATLVDAVRSTMGARRADLDAQCPRCGSFLDAPRVNPLTGRMARKCAVCQEWHPLDGSFSEYAE